MTDTYEVTSKTFSSAIVRPPGSKSITNRALIAAALAAGESRISAPLHSDDTEAMSACLRSLGVRVNTTKSGFDVRSTGYLRGGGALDARASGTTARFVTAAATLADGPSVVDGTPRMRQRPIGDLVDTLQALGASVTTTENAGFPPVRVDGGGLLGGRASIDASQSSQFVSAVMLSAPRAQQPVILELGHEIVSRPYLDTTMEVMSAFGAHVAWKGESTIRVESITYRPTEFLVEADASAAIYPWAMGAVTGATVTVTGIDPSSTQADMGALDVLAAMGCSVRPTFEGITVTGPEELSGVSVDMNRCPDAVLGISVVAAFADTDTRIHNIANLRIKETDRLAALEVELTKLGARVTTGANWIHIVPGPTRPARIATYDDHRMAMSFAVAGLRQPGIVIEDPGCVSKTWPEFFNVMESL